MSLAEFAREMAMEFSEALSPDMEDLQAHAPPDMVVQVHAPPDADVRQA